jgi:hypothetical protein
VPALPPGTAGVFPRPPPCEDYPGPRSTRFTGVSSPRHYPQPTLGSHSESQHVPHAAEDNQSSHISAAFSLLEASPASVVGHDETDGGSILDGILSSCESASPESLTLSFACRLSTSTETSAASSASIITDSLLSIPAALGCGTPVSPVRPPVTPEVLPAPFVPPVSPTVGEHSLNVWPRSLNHLQSPLWAPYPQLPYSQYPPPPPVFEAQAQGLQVQLMFTAWAKYSSHADPRPGSVSFPRQALDNPRRSLQRN